MHVYVYATNFLVGLSCSIIHEGIILSEPKKNHLTLTSYPKMSDVMDMVGVVRRLHHP